MISEYYETLRIFFAKMTKCFLWRLSVGIRNLYQYLDNIPALLITQKNGLKSVISSTIFFASSVMTVKNRKSDREIADLGGLTERNLTTLPKISFHFLNFKV
jgi:hypothetical protein